jgi:hypothetical protein
MVGGQLSHRLVYYPQGGEDDQGGFDGGGEVFDLAVAVGVMGVRRLGGLADREKAIRAAMRSTAEWAASDTMLTAPLARPTASLMTTSVTLEIIDNRAVFCFKVL